MRLTELIGQPKAVNLLQRALAGGRLAHAYLLAGPDGVGKATAARAVAAALLCREEIGSAPCGACPGCLQFASGNHPDFLHIRPDGAVIKIDQVRELKKALAFPPLEARLRVTLLEEVHTMRREAANSLLKLLEEPPPDNLLLLTTDEAEPLLPTIFSRCQVIPFSPLSLEVSAAILLKMHPGLDQEGARTLAGLAGGSPGRTRDLDHAALLQLHRDILTGLLAGHAGEADRVVTALGLAARVAKNEGLETLLDLLRLFFKDTMIAATCSRGQSHDRGPHHLVQILSRARERWNLQELSDSIQTIDFAQQALARNCNRQMVCDVLFLRLLAETPQQQATRTG
ncbi:MAG TPA: DNA polymerase III subunit delta' [Desulfobulbaceae bacterium]|nr:DNA polymerase III subunit delta' [Desulfobulbaceae bacterium]